MKSYLLVGVLTLFLNAITHAELRFGIEPRGGVQETFVTFSPLAEYLTQELKQPVHIQVPKDFEEYGENLKRGSYDFSFAAPATILYHIEIDSSSLIAVAIDKESGASLKGIFIVRQDSPIRTLPDLKGKKIAYVARSSQGYIVQSYLLRQAGIDIRRDIHEEFLGKLMPAVASVINENSDAAGVGDVAFSRLSGKLDMSSLRVLSTSPATPNWIVVSQNPAYSDSLKKALLKLKPGSTLSKTVMGDKGFVGFDNIDMNDLAYLRKAVAASKSDE